MIVTDVRHKLLIFTQETGISKQEISKELGYHYGLSDRFYGEVEKLFRRTGYIKALDNKGRL
jgi:hypothetical protein